MMQTQRALTWLLCFVFVLSISGAVSAQERKQRKGARVAGAAAPGTVKTTEQHNVFQLSAETLRAYSAQNVAYSMAVQQELARYIAMLQQSGAPQSQIDQMINMANAFRNMAPAYEELWAAIANTGSPLYFCDDGRVFIGNIKDLTNYDTPTVYLASGSALLCTWSQCFWGVGQAFANDDNAFNAAMAGQVTSRIDASRGDQVIEVDYSAIGQVGAGQTAADTETGLTHYSATLTEGSRTTTTTSVAVSTNEGGRTVDTQTRNDTLDGMFNWNRTLQYNLIGSTSQNITAHQNIGYNYFYFDEGCKNHCCSPLVLDMRGAGKVEASQGQWRPHPGKFDKTRVAEFDFWGNGFPVLMEWVGPNDGLLCMPKADGTLDGTCFFGVVEGYLDGFGKLKVIDKNRDGVIAAEELKGLYVWQDKVQNAKIDEGELQTVQALGITKISLTHRKDGVGSFVMNGRSHYMFDWWPTMAEVKKVNGTALITPPKTAAPATKKP